MIGNPVFIDFNRDEEIKQPEWIIPGLRAWAASLPTYHSVNEYPEEVSI
jgi:hypothetical protein